MIKALRIGSTIVCTIGEKMYRKQFESDADILEVYELAMNTDETNSQDVQKLLDLFSIPLTAEEQEQKDYGLLLFM